MKLKVITGIVLTLFLIGMLALAFNIQPVNAEPETIYIRANGAIDPPTANITSVDNVTYTFTGNIVNDSIVVERDNIVVDGAGYTIQGTGSGTGISMTGRSNVTIKNMEIKAFWYGICFHSSLNNNIAGNKITNNDDGIYLWDSSNNAISGNNITNNRNGVGLAVSSNNTMESNNVTTNRWTGVYLYGSSNNVLRGNNLSLNKYNFGVYGWDLSQFINDVDVSNFVNGKPIYYLINQRNLTIDPVGFPTIGYLALVNSTNITVKNLNLTQNWEGILLAYTRNSTTKSNNITNNLCGVWLGWSSNNAIKSNSIAAKGPFSDGIYLEGSSNNTLSGNNITNNENGIDLQYSSNYNGICGNNITNNDYGIYLYKASNNRIYHNNFIDNAQQVYIEVSGYANLWDNGVEGNYWSSYTEVDLDHNGIGDTEHVIDVNNIDNYPLMGMFHSFNTSLGYAVNIISNSTIEDFQYFESNSTIRMHISNMTANQTFGFCRVCIPKVLVPPPYTVVIDDGLTEVLYFNDTVYDNSTHRWIYFAYEHSAHKVEIIPEFPTWTSILLILIVLTFATAIYKRRLPKQKNGLMFFRNREWN